MLHRWFLAAALALPCLVFAQDGSPEVPYVPTPQNVVDEMLKLGDVKKGDVLFDLGSGDGRIVVTAAQRYGVKGTGIDIDPERIREAEENAKNAKVTSLASFKQANLFDADLRNASVVTLYLLPSVNMKLRPKLWKELKPGARVVSHSFDMGDWKPDKVVEIEHRKLYLWVITPGMASQAKAE